MKKKISLTAIFHRKFYGLFLDVLSRVHLNKTKNIQPIRVKRVLVISLDYIGDYVVRTIPDIYLLKKLFTDAAVTVMAGSWTEELVSANPLVSGVITYNAGWLDRSGKRWGLVKKLKVLNYVRKEKFDVIVYVRGSIGTAALGILKLGVCSINLNALYPDATIAELNKVDFSKRFFPTIANWRLLKEQFEDNKRNFIQISDKDRRSAKELMTREAVDFSRKIVLVHPGAQSVVKRWDNEKWAELCDGIVDRYDAEVIICGPKSDAAIANDIIRRMRHRGKNLSGKTSLLQLAALIDMSDLCISIDSGPMHIAGLLDVPVVGLFGPNNPKTCQPLTTKCRLIFKDLPCTDCVESMMRCRTECMSAITCEDVISAADELISTFWSPQKS